MAWGDITNPDAWKSAMANLLRKGGEVTDYIQQAPEKAGQAILDAGQRQQALMNEAFDPTGKTLIRNPQAANQAAMNLLEGPLGFAPAGIISPKVVNQLGMATTLPKDDIFTQAVSNTPLARISDEGLHINLMRKQKPQQAMTESVRSGVFYLPEGSAQAKYYGGSNNYGGTEKISGETLYKNPLFVKGATGGKAPEAAYNQLLGKGAYEQMRQDALRVRHPDLISDKRYNLSDAITPEQFLEKYAPDLKGMGDYIFRNSREGNQLPYALQEAAVAQKVRDAGYDAVIGHSKGKKGPYISEVFDIRESHYPDVHGNFELNPKFEEMYQNAPRRQIIEEQLNKIK